MWTFNNFPVTCNEESLILLKSAPRRKQTIWLRNESVIYILLNISGERTSRVSSPLRFRERLKKKKKRLRYRPAREANLKSNATLHRITTATKEGLKARADCDGRAVMIIGCSLEAWNRPAEKTGMYRTKIRAPLRALDPPGRMLRGGIVISIVAV